MSDIFGLILSCFFLGIAIWAFSFNPIISAILAPISLFFFAFYLESLKIEKTTKVTEGSS